MFPADIFMQVSKILALRKNLKCNPIDLKRYETINYAMLNLELPIPNASEN